MLEKLNNTELTRALDDVIRLLGMRKEVLCHELVHLLRCGNVAGCIQQIARQLQLPIHVELSLVSSDYHPDSVNGFISHTFSTATTSQQRTEGIVAQVSIPGNLPIYGSQALHGFPIRVRISENCKHEPFPFITIMLHEMSHVLLASLRSAFATSELHTDLVPIVLGFRDTARRGRWFSRSVTDGAGSLTVTAKYGYLTDDQFAFACAYVEDQLVLHGRDVDRLRSLARQTSSRLKKALRHRKMFLNYLAWIDEHPPRMMNHEHAQLVVRLHGSDENPEWEAVLIASATALQTADTFLQAFDQSSSISLDQLALHMKAVLKASSDIRNTAITITKYERVLRKYVGITVRFRNWLHPGTRGIDHGGQ